MKNNSSVEKINDEVIKGIFYEKLVRGDDNSKALSDLIKKQYIKGEQQFPTALCTKFVYNHFEELDVEEGQKSTWEDNIVTLKATENMDAEYQNFLDKIHRNISVAFIQYELISEQVAEAQEKIDNFDAKLRKAENKLTKQTKSMRAKLRKAENKLTKQTKSMYANFVSVLGIFVAITFSAFGVVQLLNRIFDVGKDPSNLTVGTNIMLSGIVTILIYSLISGLMSSITLIIDKVSDSDDQNNPNDVGIWNKNFKLVLGLSIFIMIIGFIYKLF